MYKLTAIISFEYYKVYYLIRVDHFLKKIDTHLDKWVSTRFILFYQQRSYNIFQSVPLYLCWKKYLIQILSRHNQPQ